jgi:hypothetical protein
MHANDLIEVLCAVHLSSYVDAPFHERGGLMIVGPPGVLKSTFVGVLDKQYGDALMLSDINAQSMKDLRDQMAAGQIRTLVLPELAKLYQRHPSTAQNVEGTLSALVAEGFSAASFEDSRVNRLKARVVVMGALTPATQGAHFREWEESGFNRRFLWSLVSLANSEALEDAVIEWKRIDFQLQHVPRRPLSGEKIPNVTTREERVALAAMLKYQPGGSHVQQLQLLTKTLAVLRWWYTQSGDTRSPMATIERFAKSLGREGALLDLGSAKKLSTKSRGKERDAVSSYAAGALARKRWDKPKRRNRRKQ